LNFFCKDFSFRFSPNIPIRPGPPRVYLVGLGGIWNPYSQFVSEKICKVGVGLPIPILERAKHWHHDVHRPKPSGRSLTDYLLARENIVTPFSISNPLKVVVLLRFTRNIAEDLFIDLLQQPLGNYSLEANDTFRAFLFEVIEDQTIRRGDEITFYWFDDGSLVVAKNGEIRGNLRYPELYHGVLNIFLDPKITISPDLYHCTVKSIPSIEPI